MTTRALFLVLVLGLLAQPAAATETVFIRGTFDGAIVRVPRADVTRCEVLRPSSGHVVLVVQGIDLAADSWFPRIEGIAAMTVLGPGVLGKDESRILLKLTTSRLVPRLVTEGDGVALHLEDEGATARRASREEQAAKEEAARTLREEAERVARAEREATSEQERVTRAEARAAAAAPPAREVSRQSNTDAAPPTATTPSRSSAPNRATTAGASGEARRAATAPPPPVPLLRPPPTVVTPRPAEGGMVHVPGGLFVMGTTAGLAFADEGPEHVAMLSAFTIDEHEVTVGEFESTGLTLPRQPDWNWGADQPVVNVTWNEAAAHCAASGKRLPTEAEWEKAARGPNALTFPWGEAWNPGRANSGLDGDAWANASPVGSFPDGNSPYGASDLAGNVWEWVADWYQPDAYASSPNDDPPGPDHGTYRVARGGSFEGQASVNVRTTVRLPLKASSRRHNVGFRCAR